MKHEIRSGETLTKIAEAHRLTLSELLEANPKFKADPNRVRVGDIVFIPERSAVTPERPAAFSSSTSTELRLGNLSEQFETGGRGAGTVSTGVGDAGGVSYGSYQMTSVPGGGTVKRFVGRPDFPFRERFAGLVPGSAAFSAAWRDLARAHPRDFGHSQHEFIRRTHFDPLVRKVLQEDGVDILACSHAVQDAIWSTGVQHGPAANIPQRALASFSIRPPNPDFDEAFIRAIYAERGRRAATGGLVYFSRNSAAVQAGVARRFVDEQRKALEVLARERRIG